MTITPAGTLPLVPGTAPTATAAVPGVDPAGNPTGNPAGVPADFLALVQQALADALGGQSGTSAEEAAAVEPEAVLDAEAPTPTPDAALAAMLGAIVMPAAEGPITLASAPVVDPGVDAAGPTAADVASPKPAALQQSAPDAGRTAPQPTAGGTTGSAAEQPAGPTLPDTATEPAPATAAPAASAAVSSTPSEPTGGPAVAVPVAAPATTTAPQQAATAPAAPVAGQVFPEVTSLVSRDDGTHRITLSLNPEALGEVKVVMTVRDGAVHVRLAAGHEAAQALRDGSPELTRLLEVAGATDTRVVVRDLAPAAPAGSSTGSGLPDLGAGNGRTFDQHAGTRADHPATDGTTDGARDPRPATGTATSRPTEPATGTRAAGVDVTI